MVRRRTGLHGIKLVWGYTDGPRKRRVSLLFINGRSVQASQTQVALFACLYEARGSIIPYSELCAILGHASGNERRHSVQQYIAWINEC
jgi:hypothetical protein